MSDNRGYGCVEDFLVITGLLNILLKATGVVDWPWWHVLLPIVLVAVLYLVLAFTE